MCNAVFPFGVAISHQNVVIFAGQSAGQEPTIFTGLPAGLTTEGLPVRSGQENLDRFRLWCGRLSFSENAVFCIMSRIISCVGSRPSDHYFRSVCLSVCLFVCLFVCAGFFSAVFDPISIKIGHMLYVWV